MSADLNALRSALRKDARFQRYVSLRDSIQGSIVCDALLQEIARIQQIRKARVKAKVGRLHPHEVMEISLDEISHRARLSEILFEANRAYMSLDAVQNGLKETIPAEHAVHLSGFRTKQERETAVSSCFRKGNEFLGQLYSVTTQCELVIEEIDKTSFQLNRIVKVMEIMLKPERIANVDA